MQSRHVIFIDTSSILAHSQSTSPMRQVNPEHKLSIVESPGPFGAGALFPIDKHCAEKKN